MIFPWKALDSDTAISDAPNEGKVIANFRGPNAEENCRLAIKAVNLCQAISKREASAWSDQTVTIIFRNAEDADAFSQLLAFSANRERIDVLEH